MELDGVGKAPSLPRYRTCTARYSAVRAMISESAIMCRKFQPDNMRATHISGSVPAQ